MIKKEKDEESDCKGKNKQVFWLSFNDDTTNFSEKAALVKDMILFSSSKQLVSFFKFLFAIKPKLQFEQLEMKFLLIIDLVLESKGRISEANLKEVLFMFEWLAFTAARISVVILTKGKIERSTKMKVESAYSNIVFVTDPKEIDKHLIYKEPEQNKIGSFVREEVNLKREDSKERKSIKENGPDFVKKTSIVSLGRKSTLRRGNTASSFKANKKNETRLVEIANKIDEESNMILNEEDDE